MSEHKLEGVLDKLSEEDRAIVESEIGSLKIRVSELERRVGMLAEMISAIWEQAQSIQISINSIARTLAPVLRVRRGGESS